MKAQNKTERKNSALITNVDKKKEMREEERVGGKRGWRNTFSTILDATHCERTSTSHKPVRTQNFFFKTRGACYQ